MTIVVDVANVMGSRPDGWWRDRPGAAVRLHAEIVRLARSGRALLPPAPHDPNAPAPDDPAPDDRPQAGQPRTTGLWATRPRTTRPRRPVSSWSWRVRRGPRPPA